MAVWSGSAAHQPVVLLKIRFQKWATLNLQMGLRLGDSGGRRETRNRESVRIIVLVTPACLTEIASQEYTFGLMRMFCMISPLKLLKINFFKYLEY